MNVNVSCRWSSAHVVRVSVVNVRAVFAMAENKLFIRTEERLKIKIGEFQYSPSRIY